MHSITVSVLLYVVFAFLYLSVIKWSAMHAKYSQKHRINMAWTQLYHLDNRSYSTIQPLTYPIYFMKIGEWLSLWDFFDKFSQKLIYTVHHKSHQTCKEVNSFQGIWILHDSLSGKCWLTEPK